ncbi:hypothetical protein BASA83_011073 [Batrachochytrium salamandrivorans]|nr:hypothetical protein BASA83_011073 [Batrachochytrium salamandrivorans]
MFIPIADDYSEMWFVGDYYGGSVADGKIRSWEEIRTYQKTVYGPGPWLIAVKIPAQSGPTAWPKLYARLETALSGESHGHVVSRMQSGRHARQRMQEVKASVCRSQQPAYAGSQQSQFPMLGGQGYDNDNDDNDNDNDNDNDDDDDLGYTGNNNQGSSYTPNSSGGYNGSPQAGQSQTAFSDQKTLTNLEAFQSLRRILRQLLAMDHGKLPYMQPIRDGFAGMFATVWVDDKVFSTTAQADNKFRMSKDQQGPGWDTIPISLRASGRLRRKISVLKGIINGVPSCQR